MRKLLLYLTVSFIFCSFGNAATKISLGDLKLKESINNFFSKQEIAEYSYEGFGYGKNSKYSVLFLYPDQLKDKQYDTITIAFNNKTKKIAYYAGFVEKFKNLNECVKFRDAQVLKNRKKFLLHKKKTGLSTHADKMLQDVVFFGSTRSEAKFTCDFFEEERNSRVDFRFDVLTPEFNKWVIELEKTKTIK